MQSLLYFSLQAISSIFSWC